MSVTSATNIGQGLQTARAHAYKDMRIAMKLALVYHEGLIEVDGTLNVYRCHVQGSVHGPSPNPSTRPLVRTVTL